MISRVFCTDKRVIKSNYLIQMFFQLFVFQSILRIYQTVDLPLPISLIFQFFLFLSLIFAPFSLSLWKSGSVQIKTSCLETGVSSKCFLIRIKILEFHRRKEETFSNGKDCNVKKIKYKITCLHTVPVVSSECPKEAAVQLISKRQS